MTQKKSIGVCRGFLTTITLLLKDTLVPKSQPRCVFLNNSCIEQSMSTTTKEFVSPKKNNLRTQYEFCLLNIVPVCSYNHTSKVPGLNSSRVVHSGVQPGQNKRNLVLTEL